MGMQDTFTKPQQNNLDWSTSVIDANIRYRAALIMTGKCTYEKYTF